MNPLKFAMRRPVITLMLVVTLLGGGFLGCSKISVGDFQSLNTPKINDYLDYIGTKAKQIKMYIVGQFESYFKEHKEEQPRGAP